ncbi:transketolase [Grimontia sp. AD028]|uniref:transketolase n=1 Tax=Grimontia sp. AD028 TaxID=1581149 RepID=UPI0009E5298C|nr:transketolase [Grimontia sp. AD028]
MSKISQFSEEYKTDKADIHFSPTSNEIHEDCANALRVLAVDMVQNANSGHPGAPMGMADIATVLWREFLKHNPKNPNWPNRDRFVLSNGHASCLIYSLLHLTGYNVTTHDLKQFRQLGSKTPGHPEIGVTPGVETTTGPLGQGLANAVGMALAEKTLAAQFNKPGFDIVDHYTYVFFGDGCLMEGISHEVCSLAGTMKLSKLIAFYDDNGISIDGDVDGWLTDDTPQRFRAYGWHVIEDIDGHDHYSIREAIMDARAVEDKPVLICCKTVIGKGSPNKAGSHDVHGAPLGSDEVANTRKSMSWIHDPFEIPTKIQTYWNDKTQGALRENLWDATFAAYADEYPELAAEYFRRIEGQLPKSWAEESEQFVKRAAIQAQSIASRQASQQSLNAFGPLLPELIGGSADLSPSNNTFWKGACDNTPESPNGNYIRFGVREFGMSAIVNGLALHGGFIPYCATFLVFSDYARNAIRVAALSKVHAIFVFTHDSIGLGEDGPTHQPIEHLASFRAMPNVKVWRPCDAVETAVAWKKAIEDQSGPHILVFSRQSLPYQLRRADQLPLIERGGYILKEHEGHLGDEPDLLLIATGSEIELAVEAAILLNRKSIHARVVSMPCPDVFDQQPEHYRNSVLPPSIKCRVSLEAGSTLGWHKYVGSDGLALGIDTFGESAPADALFEHFGLTVERIVRQAERVVKQSRPFKS